MKRLFDPRRRLIPRVMRAIAVILALILLIPVVSNTFTPPEAQRVIVRLKPGADPSQLSGLGELGPVLGDLAVLEMRPWVSLDDVRGSEAVEEVFEPRRFRLSLEVSVPMVHAPEVWKGFKDAEGRPVDGRGVAIAIIDTGIDYRHPDFWLPNGSSKILAIWDQTIQGRPPKGFNYGYECLREDIEEGVCPETDDYGHGTHVASIAAGTGAAGPYKGVAPGAWLIVVKSGRPVCGGEQWSLSEDEIIDGMLYAFGKAEELGLRLVINLSLGGDLGPHDGSTPLEEAIEELSRKGVIVVVAAGNSAEDGIHASGRLREDVEETLEWVIPPDTTEFSISLNLYPGNKANLTLTTPHGEIEFGRTLGRIHASLTVNELEKGVEYLVEVSSIDGAPLPTQPWSMKIKALQVSGDPTWHAWIESDTCSPFSERFLGSDGYDVSPEYTVSIPATSPYAIAVGGYVSKNRWVNYLGERLETGYRVGDLLPFSGRGPTRDGRIKPDITAPGSIIVAAKPLGPPSSTLDINEYYTVKHGTSMAAPHVAGAVALILQLFPNASYQDVYQALISAAERVGETPSNEWGWGKLNAKAFRMLRVVAETPMEVEAAIQGKKVRIGGGEAFEAPVLAGSPINTTFQEIIQVGEYSRLRLEEKREETLGDVSMITVRYVLEHYLEVESMLGGVMGEGWYANGSLARFSAREIYTPIGVEILFKPALKLVGWRDEEGRLLTRPEILMTSPHRVEALYEADYGPLTLAWLFIAGITASTILVLRRVYSKRGRAIGQ